jgi:hypothetical protein
MSLAIDLMDTAVIAETSNIERVDSFEKPPTKRVVTLGTVRHRHEHTNEILPIPTPSANR